MEYSNVNIIIDENYLYFNNIKIDLENIESVRCVREPRRNPFIGLKRWFYGFLIILVICGFSNEYSIIGEIYCLSLPVLILFNMYMFLRKYYKLIIRTISGQEHSVGNRKLYYLEQIKNVIDQAKEEKSKRNNTSVIVNNGIISSGNNNKNKIINKKRNTNYTKSEEKSVSNDVIINKGNNNTNKVINNKTYINYNKIEEELKTLLYHVQEDKDIVKEAIEITKEKNSSKLKKCLSKLGKGTLLIIKELGLMFLEKYIETNILK